MFNNTSRFFPIIHHKESPEKSQSKMAFLAKIFKPPPNSNYFEKNRPLPSLMKVIPSILCFPSQFLNRFLLFPEVLLQIFPSVSTISTGVSTVSHQCSPVSYFRFCTLQWLKLLKKILLSFHNFLFDEKVLSVSDFLLSSDL